jgi:hypothetical protein
LEPERESSSPSQSSLWPLALLGILFSWLAFSASKGNQCSKPIHPQDTADHKCGSSRAKVDVVSQVPPPPSERNDTNRSKDPTPRWKKIAEIAVAVSTLGLLIVNIFQSRATRDAADAAKNAADSAVAANRPWIVADSPPQHKRTIQEANLEWRNAGKTPAVAVFSMVEYFLAGFPRRLRTCSEMEIALKTQDRNTWQYQAFVAQDGRYETGLSNTPAWSGPAPLNIHGCVWYTDVLSNTERTSEFFYMALDGRFGFPASGGISLFYSQDRPLVYK